MEEYVIGIDFGTLSARCLLVDASSGAEICETVYTYPHGVMDERLPSGEILPKDFALQDPFDYIGALKNAIPELLSKSGVPAEKVKGVGIDFTSCTMLPIDKVGAPLSSREEFKNNKHAYVKLWKHHSAGREAEDITSLAKERGETWLFRYGGNISCEWALPKILEILREAPEIYEATDRFIEAGDWISLLLTGKETHSIPFAGYKWLWDGESGFPSNEFFSSLDKRLSGIVGTKISDSVQALDGMAGYIDKRAAALTGLAVGTAVALPMIDAHAAMPALNITGDGELMLIVGTSSCQILNSKTDALVEGVCGYVRDGVIPGLYTYEAGQAGVGDIFDWFVNNSVPATYEKEASERGVSLHRLLGEKARGLSVGESGIVALDWWNGNRSVLVDPSLSGAIVGLTLRTRPEHIYRALIEASAFGFKRIVEQYEKSGVSVKKISAAGGIPSKDEFMMQIYADVLGRDIVIAESAQAGALGGAIYASVAAGIYPDIVTAAQRMSSRAERVYKPIPENVLAYGRLYEEYKTLHDYFGRENKIMKRLRDN